MYNIIYIEKSIANHDNTLRICRQFSHAQIIYIEHYKDVFNQSGSNWRMQKENQKLILAKRTDNFYYKGSDVTPSFGYKHFYYNTVALNCIYDCAYCYLQGLFSSGHMVLFVNNDDFIHATEQLIKNVNNKIYLALSYDTDLLAIEKWYPYCSDWIAFAAEQPNLTIEIRTKSANINAIANSKAIPNVILAWTISPDEIIKAYEAKTPPLESRLKAIQKVQAQGWRVRLCFDPIIDVADWGSVYSKAIQQVSSHIDLAKIDSISLGVFRMNKAFLKQIQKQRQDKDIFFKQYELDNDCYATPNKIKELMYKHVSNELLQLQSNLAIEVM